MASGGFLNEGPSVLVLSSACFLWAALKELESSYHNLETLLCDMYPCYGRLNSRNAIICYLSVLW